MYIPNFSLVKDDSFSFAYFKDLVTNYEKTDAEINQICSSLSSMNQRTKQFQKELELLSSIENFLRLGIKGRFPDAQKKTFEEQLATTLKSQFSSEDWWNSCQGERHPSHVSQLYKKLDDTMDKLMSSQRILDEFENDDEYDFKDIEAFLKNNSFADKLKKCNSPPEMLSILTPRMTNKGGGDPDPKSKFNAIDCFSNELILGPRANSPPDSSRSFTASRASSSSKSRESVATTNRSTPRMKDIVDRKNKSDLLDRALSRFNPSQDGNSRLRSANISSNRYLSNRPKIENQIRGEKALKSAPVSSTRNKITSKLNERKSATHPNTLPRINTLPLEKRSSNEKLNRVTKFKAKPMPSLTAKNKFTRPASSSSSSEEIQKQPLQLRKPKSNTKLLSSAARNPTPTSKLRSVPTARGKSSSTH